MKKEIKSTENKKSEVLDLTGKILKILYIVILFLGIYVLTLVLKEWGVITFVLKILGVLSPLFIGLLFAWILDPFVKKITSKGMNRVFGSVIVYLTFVVLIYFVISLMIPMFAEQVNDFIKLLPEIVEKVKDWAEGAFSSFGISSNYNFDSIQQNLFTSIEEFASSLTNNLPEQLVNLMGSIVSVVGVILIGLIIGFYLLFDFNNVNHSFITFLPKKWRPEAIELVNEVNTSLRNFVQGTLFISTIIFIVTSLVFWIIGIEAPLLFGLICGLTNIIPYVGPYIGGAPVALVAFTQSITLGIITVVAVFVIQFVEGSILQPLIMGKTMRLHPVTIIIGLLVFGSLFGIIGMILATPIIAVLKLFVTFLDRKFDIFKWISL